METDLHDSARRGEISKVKTLILSGASVNARNNDGSTPLHLAAGKGRREVVEEMIKCTPLHLSAYNIRKEIVDVLVREGAQLDVQDRRGRTPLHLSLCQNNCGWWGMSNYCKCYRDIIIVLVNSGASVNIKDYKGLTALHLCALHGWCEVVRMLINHGCEIDPVNRDIHTPLHLAQMNGRKNVVDILINSGSSVNIKDRHGRSPLHWSSHHGWCDIVRMLINSGCEIDPVDRDGHAPLQLAQKKGHKDVVDILINSGSSVNIKDRDGRTLLHWSSHHGWCEIVRMLINSGCEIDPVDNTGQTPLQLAKQKENLDIVNLLREAKPFQHGDSKTLYLMKETVKIFFGFSRTVEREERGAVGGRNIQSGDINAEILDNTVEPLSTVSVPSEVVTWPSTSGSESLPTFTDKTSTTDQRETDTFQSVAACIQYTEESTVSTERLTATTVPALPPVISTTSSPYDVTTSPLTATCTSKTGTFTTSLSSRSKQTPTVSLFKTDQRSRTHGKRQCLTNLPTVTRSRSVDSLLPCSVLPVTKFHTPPSDISASAHQATAITSSSLSASATPTRLTVTSPTSLLLSGTASTASVLAAIDNTSSPLASAATSSPTEWMSTLPPQGSCADPVDLLPPDFKQFVRDCQTRPSDSTGYSSHKVDNSGTYNFHYTVHNHNYYSCDHEDGACRKLTASTSRLEEHVCNASTINTTPVTCSRTSERSSFLMASQAEGAATASFTHGDDTNLPDTTVLTSSETMVTSLGTTIKSSFMTSSPQRASASISPQTSDAYLLTSTMTATPTSSSTVTSPLASTSLSLPPTVTTSPLTTVSLSLPSTYTATSSPSTSPTAAPTSPSSALVTTPPPSTASSDLAETLTKFTEQLKTVLQSTPGEDQRSSTFAVETSGSGNTSLLHVYNVSLNPSTTTNVHKAETCAVGSNIRYIKRRKSKKRKDENNSESDRTTQDSDDTESSASGL